MLQWISKVPLRSMGLCPEAAMCRTAMMVYVLVALTASTGYFIKLTFYSSPGINDIHTDREALGFAEFSAFSIEWFLLLLHIGLYATTLGCLSSANTPLRLMVGSALLLSCAIVYVLFYVSGEVSAYLSAYQPLNGDSHGEVAALNSTSIRNAAGGLVAARTAATLSAEAPTCSPALDMLSGGGGEPLSFTEFFGVVADSVADMVYSALDRSNEHRADLGKSEGNLALESLHRLDALLYSIVGLLLGVWGVVVFDVPVNRSPPVAPKTGLTAKALKRHAALMTEQQEKH